MLKKQISIFGSHSGHNKGDVAILDSMVERFQREEKINRILVPAKDPAYLSRVQSTNSAKVVPALTNYLDKNLIQYLLTSDAVIIGGGGLIFDRKLFSLGHNHLTNIYILTRLCNILGKDYYLFSVGVDNLQSSLSKKMFRSIIESAADTSVRDQYSLKEVQQYTNNDISLVPDPALRLESIRSNQVDKLTGTINSSDKPSLAFFVKDSVKSYKSDIAGAISKLSNKYSVFVGQTRTDQSFSREIANEVGDGCSVIFEKNHLNGNEHIELLEEFDRSVCIPMHSSIFAYLSGTPYVSVAYQEKVRGFNNLVDNEFVVSLDRISQVPSHVESLHDQQLVPRHKLIERIESGFLSVINSI